LAESNKVQKATVILMCKSSG